MMSGDLEKGRSDKQPRTDFEYYIYILFYDYYPIFSSTKVISKIIILSVNGSYIMQCLFVH